MLARFGIALLILFGGMDLIWLGCQENGSNNRFNPVWGFLDGIVTLEEYALFAVLGFGLVSGAIYLFAEFTKPKCRSEFHFDPIYEPRNRYGCVREDRQAMYEASRREDEKRLKVQVEAERVSSLYREEKVPSPIKVIPPKPKPTPEELKQKAIQDILRR